jgi:uncharacterized membrane protein YkvA (DUF1232 family)
MSEERLSGNSSNQKKEVPELSSWFKPLSQRGIPVWLVYLAALLSVIYILNPTAGTLELIPDILPIIGNLDEGVASILIWYGLVELFEGRN